MSVDLRCISPSGVGAYIACGARLVFDSVHGKPFKSSPAADFGTLCHWTTMYTMGLNPPSDKINDQLISSARSMRDFRGLSEAQFNSAVTDCAKCAIEHLPALPAGLHWTAEVNAYDKTLLSKRIGRDASNVGFGGNIDLLRSDKKELWDFKFTGELPSELKIEYLWQLASYHLLTGAQNTGILFVTRDARNYASLVINWKLPEFEAFAKKARNAIERLGSAEFENSAVPVEGAHCEYCPHKLRCAAKRVPILKYGGNVEMLKRETIEPSTIESADFSAFLALQTEGPF